MRYLLLTGFILTSFIVWGQQPFGADSLYTNFTGQQRLDFLFRHVSLIDDSLRQDVGVATLSFDHVERNFRTSQIAQSTTNAALEARGISYLGKRTVVSGTFHYHKTWEDSLAYYLAGLESNSMPTYYFVEKAGKFERQTYHAEAHVGHWLSNNWKVDAALDYTHHWATRSVDPRMDLYSMTWLFKPAISYAFGRNLLSLQPLYGRGTAQTNMSYKSRTIGAGNENSEYHHISSYGYGTIQALDSTELRQYDRYLGLSLQGKRTGDAIDIFWNAGYVRRVNESTHDIQNLDNYHIAQSFTLNTVEADLLFAQPRANGGSLRLHFTSRDAVDGHRYRGQNYFLSQWEAGMKLLKNMGEQSRWPVELGLDLRATYDERDDAASGHYAERQWLDLAMPTAVTHVWNKQERLRWQIQPALRIPLHNTLNIPSTQINRFSIGIAYPEFYYYAVKAISLESKLTFLTHKLWDKAPIGFFVEVGLAKPFRYQAELFPATAIYTGNNMRIRAGLSFYL